jgi:NAD(P)H-dependent flavin oxidoreductase YrpB (nitropropane dioxygenase family)
MTLLSELGATSPVVAAPMAGGPTTPDLVRAAAATGSLGFLAGGYRTAQALMEQVAAVRRTTALLGVNLFAPHPVPVDPADYAAYLARLRPLAERRGVALPEQPREDDDGWAEKLDLLVADPVPVVSFTFGIPSERDVARLRRAGTVVAQTVTSAAEARAAAYADLLVVQGPGAGGHSGTLTPERVPVERALPEVVAEVAAVSDLPLIAAGGVTTCGDVAAALAAGAAAVAVGTALLLTPEAGTSAAHRAALLGPDRGPTVMTRAFSGRPARAVPNRFLADHDPHAPSGYPAVHHLTSPLRRAAAAAGDPEEVNLWAGTGYRRVQERPVAAVLADLVAGL